MNSMNVEQVKVVFASTYALYLKTQNFHWNVTGNQFASLHLMFQSQYEALAEAVDELAEQIRVIGESVPATFSELTALSTTVDSKTGLTATEMLCELLAGNLSLANMIEQVISKCEDEGTAAILSERLVWHQKTAWMLRSSIGE